MEESQSHSWIGGTDPFTDLRVPPELEQSIQRHRLHLAQLIRSMQTAGMNASQIEESVAVIVQSYKGELTRAIQAMAR